MTPAGSRRSWRGQSADDKELLAADVGFVATPPAALDDVAAALKGYAGVIVSAMGPRFAACLCGVVTCSTMIE
jgi:hypothetical protein